MTTDFDKLIQTIVRPLVEYPDDITIDHFETNRFFEYHLNTNPRDVGRIIGKKGHIAQTIRTIIYSVRIDSNKKIRLIIDDGHNKNS